MWPDWVSNPGPLTYKSCALPTGLWGLASGKLIFYFHKYMLDDDCSILGPVVQTIVSFTQPSVKDLFKSSSIHKN